MLINSQILIQKINEYFNKEIKKEDLGLWAMEAYYALIEYIEVGKLEKYHFLRKISTFHMVPNDITGEYPCSEKEVLEVKEILCGGKDMHYTFNLKVFKSIYQNEAYKWREEEFKYIH